MEAIGIPLEDIGQKLRALNESLKKHNMAVLAETDFYVTVNCIKNEERATYATIKVALLNDKEK